MTRKDEWGVVIPAPLQGSVSALSGKRYGDKHRGPAVVNAYELSRCWIDLAVHSEAWPAPEDLPPLMVEFAQSIPDDQRADWLRRQANIEEADRLISYAIRCGDLPIWVAPQGEPERLVATGALATIDTRSISGGVFCPLSEEYKSDDDKPWLWERPLFVKRDDWAKFAARIDSAKKPVRTNGKFQSRSPEGDQRQWLRISKAVRILHRILRTRLAGQEPAPWIDPPADPFDAECENATHRHRRTARTSFTMRRALLSGDLTAHLVKDGHSHPLPGWAWENSSAAESAFNFNWLPLNPLLAHGMEEFGDWRCFVSRATFKKWVAGSLVAEIGDLPTLPAPFDIDARPDQLAHREPPEKSFVELTQALTWIAFAVSLSRDEFSFMASCQFGPFSQNGWADALRVAMADLTDQASAGNIRVRGRYVANYSDHTAAAQANTDYLSDTQLCDFASFDSLYGGLERGAGLVWEGNVLERALNGRSDGWRDVEVGRADLLACFPAPVGPVPLVIFAGESSLPENNFDPSAHAEISPWWTALQAKAWVATHSAAFVEHVGQSEAHNNGEMIPYICSAMALLYVSRNACTCSAKSLDSTSRWDSCTCLGDAGRLILEQIRQSHLHPIQKIGGVSRTMAFHEFAGVGQRPRGEDWHNLKPAPIFSSAEVIAAFPHDAPSEQSAIAATSTARAECECRLWLANAFAADPDKRRKKADFETAALAEFSGRLSARGFKRVWDAVAPNVGRSKPGRKS